MTYPTNKSSGDLGVSNAQLVVGKSILAGVVVHAAAADVVVTIYDNTAASGKLLFKYTLDFSLNNLSAYITIPNVRSDVGLWVVVTGAGAEVVVHYR